MGGEEATFYREACDVVIWAAERYKFGEVHCELGGDGTRLASDGQCGEQWTPPARGGGRGAAKWAQQ